VRLPREPGEPPWGERGDDDYSTRHRQGEEPTILEKIHRGERIHHFETVRQCKDGNLVDISLTISAIRNFRGEIVGASKIARDITELRKARDRQQLLLREMSHRVKNLFALSGSIVGLSARSAKSVQELAQSTRERLSSLARAHNLTFSHGADEVAHRPTTLKSLIRTVVAPFDEPDDPHVAVSGIDAAIAGSALSSLALLLHEFVTNAANYGALSSDTGTVEIVLAEDGDAIVLDWTERGGPPVTPQAGARDSVAFCRVSPSQISLTVKSPETGSPKGSPSDYPFLDRASLINSVAMKFRSPYRAGRAGGGQ